MKEDELLMRRLRASLLKKKGLSLVTQYLGNCSDCCGMVKGGKLKQKEKKKRFSPPNSLHFPSPPRLFWEGHAHNGPISSEGRRREGRNLYHLVLL